MGSQNIARATPRLFKGQARREWREIAKVLPQLPEQVPPPEQFAVKVRVHAGERVFHALAARPDSCRAEAYELDDKEQAHWVDLQFVHDCGRWFVIEVTDDVLDAAEAVSKGAEGWVQALPLDALVCAVRADIPHA